MSKDIYSNFKISFNTGDNPFSMGINKLSVNGISKPKSKKGRRRARTEDMPIIGIEMNAKNTSNNGSNDETSSSEDEYIKIKKKREERKQQNNENSQSNGDNNTNTDIKIDEKMMAESKYIIETNEIKKAIILCNKLYAGIYKYPQILSPLFYNIKMKYIDKLISIVNNIFSNDNNEYNNYLVSQIIMDNFAYEYVNTSDMHTFLRSSSSAIKVLSAYMDRKLIKKFVDTKIKTMCDILLENPDENCEIDPINVSNESMHAEMNWKPTDGMIMDKVNFRVRKLKKHCDFILKHLTNVDDYPYSLRLLCKKLYQLSINDHINNKRLSKLKSNKNDIHNNHQNMDVKTKQKLANKLVGGLIFLRIFNPKLHLFCHKIFEWSDAHKKKSKVIKRKFTLLTKIIQNISNQTENVKETWMQPLNEYTKSKFDDMNIFFKNIIHVDDTFTNNDDNSVIEMKISDVNYMNNMLNDSFRERFKDQGRSMDQMNRNAYKNIRSIVADNTFQKIQNRGSGNKYIKINVV